ncbi:MAG: class I SAM-dependent methyltransferase [Bacteroidota bacterium]
MQKRHSTKKQYFTEQGITTKKHVIPYVEPFVTIDENTRVLEIGCGEAGNLVPFIERGCECVGVDLNGKKLELGQSYIEEILPGKKIALLKANIYDVTEKEIGTFDFIFMRDVIEHIIDQKKFLAYVKRFLSPGGRIFFGFPPWYMPFGGHQQVCKNKIAAKLPYYHLLPKPLYVGLLKMFGENEATIKALLEVKETGISIERFNRIIKENNFKVDRRTYFLFNPNYEIKFGVRPRKQFSIISVLPFFRNFFTTCCYCLIHDK